MELYPKNCLLHFKVPPPNSIADNFPALRKEHWLLSQGIPIPTMLLT